MIFFLEKRMPDSGKTRISKVISMLNMLKS